MKRTHLVLAAVVALIAALLVYLLVIRDGDAGPRKAGGDGPDRGSGTGKLGGGAGSDDATSPAFARPSIDPPDPDGPIRLEGQVLDQDDQPVGGAQVWVSSQPPRSTTTEDDGGFVFEKLLPREYAVTARSGELIGGPVMYTLGPNAAPLVVRLREGAALTVKVTDETSGEPVTGATVRLVEMGAGDQTTRADGLATFRGLGAGWSQVEVRATGYAPASTLVTIGVAGSSQEVAVALRKGALLAGKVVDQAGAAVPGALVTLHDAASQWAPDADTTMAGADGAWSFPTVAAGSYTVSARDRVHAPGVSEIVTLDGSTSKKDVVITLSAGGRITGRVVTARKEPAPFASVQVAPRSAGPQAYWELGEGGSQFTCDAQGKFELVGLPRAGVRIRAESDQAASAIVDVDLLASAEVDGIELVLDVEGMISGIVVDAAGDPVPEAQVSAMADFFGKDGDLDKLDDMELTGFAGATTDGGGAFHMRGLPDGPYRLWASRTQAGVSSMFTSTGTPAKTGDTAVRIVLPAPGGVEGRVAFADGKAPTLAMVSVGVMPASPIRDGEFAVRDLPPGKYDVKIRGADFAELIRRDVEVEAGKINDLGTLTLKRGRRVAGKVIDSNGQPVAGARVQVGEILFSEGAAGHNQAIEEQMGLRTATSAADGSFSIQGAPAKGGSIIAEHAEHGRSDAIPVAAGEQDVLALTLTLRGFGSVAGKVTMDGEPVAEAQVMASAKGSTGHITVVASATDGGFVIDKLPEGEHKITATRMQNMQMTSGSAEIVVVAGKRTEVTVVIPVGKVTLTVQIKGKAGAQLDAAQVFLFRGAIAARNAKEITDRFLAGDGAGMGFWLGGTGWPKFEKLVAGDYTVCTLPVNGNIADMQFQQRLQENMEHLMVYCTLHPVTAAPEQQTFIATVPAMTPLPPEPPE